MLLVAKASAITVDVLFASFRRGLRNGNWRKLKERERALFKAALCLSEARRKDRECVCFGEAPLPHREIE
nr:hypothetical protein [Methanophagales archaeon]